MAGATIELPAGLITFPALIALPLIIAACQKDGNLRPAGIFNFRPHAIASPHGVGKPEASWI